VENFTPFSSLLGGGLIGLAAAMLLLLNGRIAGVSGVVGDLLRPTGDGPGWRIAFLVGLIAGPLLFQLMAGDMPPITIEANFPLLIVAGLMVGFGTNLGSGCTSGHGVCGIARLSPRSITATVVFMLAGMITVYIVRHVVS
jgi:uncharacterized membrane protein YedE/YeeE